MAAPLTPLHLHKLREGGRRQKWWVAAYYYNVCDLIWLACSWSHGEEAAVDSIALESSDHQPGLPGSIEGKVSVMQIIGDSPCMNQRAQWKGLG